MKVQATLTHQVDVKPINFMKCLLESELNWRNWVIEENGKYFEVNDEDRYTQIKFEISKERYDYIKAIQLIISKLENDK